MTKIVSAFIFILFTFIYPQAISATDFSVSYDAHYSINKAGTAEIIQKGLLTNLTDQKFVSSLDLNFPKNIKDVTAYDDFGTIEPDLIRQKNQTIVRLNFNHKLLGIGKSISFGISYKLPAIAKYKDNIWTIDLPPADNSSNTIAYNLSLTVPDSFGKLQKADPAPISGLTWRKEQIEEAGPRLTFSPPQTFSPSPSVFPQSSKIAPPFIILLILLIAFILLVGFILKSKHDH